jgi:bacillithiol system protein YtxJ
MPSNGFVELNDAATLEEFLKRSEKTPVVLFKHSNTCGISARAHHEMARVKEPVGIITVQRARALSAEIERRFNLPHETPQVLVIHHDQVVWHASHSGVRAQAVESALVEKTQP